MVPKDKHCKTRQNFEVVLGGEPTQASHCDLPQPLVATRPALVRREQPGAALQDNRQPRAGEAVGDGLCVGSSANMLLSEKHFRRQVLTSPCNQVYASGAWLGP
jgi:hypothetical protein